MKKEIQIFLTAILFFTRIPCPKWVDHDPEFLQKSVRYFSLVGIIVGSIGAFVFYGFSFIFFHRNKLANQYAIYNLRYRGFS